MADNFAALGEGTIVRDALEPKLETGVTLNAAGTTNGTAIDCLRPMEARVMLALGTVASTGNTATLNVEIKASNDSTFATGVVSLGRFEAISGTDAAQSNTTYFLEINSQKRYLRATAILGGTAPVYTGATIRVVDDDYLRNDNNTA